jgi:hypothetical protein
MKLFHIVFLALITISAAQSTRAQQTQEFVPQGVKALAQSASSKTDLTLDHSMLVLAAKLDSNNEDLRRVIAGVRGVSVHNYRFHGPWMYEPAELDEVKQEYQQAGWKQLVNKHDKSGDPGATEVWICFENNAVSHVAVLVARANEVNFIVVSGSMSPLDLVHLGGHFGIPKIEGGVLVPAERVP